MFWGVPEEFSILSRSSSLLAGESEEFRFWWGIEDSVPL
jgi:hypothetical protein